MATKRQPLANNTNAINSPFRAPTLKRPRSNAVEVIDLEPNQSPPKKRQLLEAHGTFGRTQHASLDHADAKVFTDRPNVQPSAFQRKLTAVRDEKWEQLRAKEIQRNSNQQQETLVAWRRHYKRIFPSFNFYFENLPQDVATKSSRKVEKLGAVCIAAFTTLPHWLMSMSYSDKNDSSQDLLLMSSPHDPFPKPQQRLLQQVGMQ